MRDRPELKRPLLALICAATLACACTKEIAEPSDGPKTGTDLLLRLRAAASKIKTLQAETRMEIYGKDDVKKGKVLVVAERPNRVQFQALSPTDDMLAVLATNGARFTSFERGGSTCFQGDACPRNMARLVPIALPPASLVSALLGDVPLIDADEVTSSWIAKGGHYRLELRAKPAAHGEPPYAEVIEIEPTRLRPVRGELRRGDTLLWTLEFEEPLAFSPSGPPKRLRFQMPRQAIDLSVEFRDVTLDDPIEPILFDVACPEGARVEVLPCEDKPSVPARDGGGGAR